MLVIHNLNEGVELFEALGSEVRIEILKALLEKPEMNLAELAKKLHVSKGTLSVHIKKLESAGLISIRLSLAKRGTQKLCRINHEKLIINIIPDEQELHSYEIELDAGQYASYDVEPTCGLATAEYYISPFDDPRYFSSPERFKASVIWFSSGYVEYRFPNQMHANETPLELQIYLEMCSEGPGIQAHYPSDIYFFVNGVKLGYWTSPGELFDRIGRFTPSWWFKNFPQYGRMKAITVNERGTFLDGLSLSNVTISDLKFNTSEEISIRIEVPKNARHVGGVTLFGKGFGDYDEGIKAKVLYTVNN